VAIIALNIVVNTSMMVYTSVKMIRLLYIKLRHKLRLWKYKRDLKKAEKYYMEGEFDASLQEGRFADKVYRNLKNHNKDFSPELTMDGRPGSGTNLHGLSPMSKN